MTKEVKDFQERVNKLKIEHVDYLTFLVFAKPEELKKAGIKDGVGAAMMQAQRRLIERIAVLTKDFKNKYND